MSAQCVGASRRAGFLRCMLHSACFYVSFCMLFRCMLFCILHECVAVSQRAAAQRVDRRSFTQPLLPVCVA
jgi:hypothetical protein